MAAETLSTEEHLLNFIKQIVVEQNVDTRNTNINVVPLSTAEDDPQYKFKIKITNESRDDLNLFAKVTELGHGLWDHHVLKPYEKERLFYTSLMKTYRQLEDKHGVSEKDRLKLPTFYGAEAAHRREILVLEDVTSRGLGLKNRLESVSWPYTRAAITELAKFHALSMAFKHENPSEFEKFTTLIPEGVFENNRETHVLLESFQNISMNAVRNENERKLKAFFESENILTSFNDLLKPLESKVILHAHFWPKNMMHKVLDDDTVEVFLLDYQTIQVGCPMTDVLHFIFTASDGPFRTKHFQELIQHYCAELAHAATKLGLEMKQEYSSEALESEMMEKLPFGLIAAVIYLPVLVLDNRADETDPDDPTPAIRDDDDFAAVQVYHRRLNEVVDNYVAGGVLVEPSKRCEMCFLC